jgi:hypothetical protein
MLVSSDHFLLSATLASVAEDFYFVTAVSAPMTQWVAFFPSSLAQEGLMVETTSGCVPGSSRRMIFGHMRT